VALLVIVNIWPLQVLRFLVLNSLPALLVAIPVVFAPEIRRALEQIGHTSDWFNRTITQRSEDTLRVTITEVVKTTITLSTEGWGGLLVIERGTGLQDVISKGGGVMIEGRVTEQLLVNIFVPNTPLHDGAVIVRDDQVVAAAVILPLSENLSISQHYGTRHRAALGISENSDAVAIVVSEENGTVSAAINGKLYPNLKRDDLSALLIAMLINSRANKTRRKPKEIDGPEKVKKPVKEYKPEALTDGVSGGKNNPNPLSVHEKSSKN
jgi:diadenylate cyclase